MDASVDLELVCPVCRARQRQQPACRRCGADLSLYVLALASVAAAQRRHAQACAAGEEERAARERRYLDWLRPSSLAALENSCSVTAKRSGCSHARQSAGGT